MTEKVILITGASSGIGEATAKKLAELGHKLILTARSEDKLNALAGQLDRDQVLVAPADATDFDAQANVVNQAISRFGRLDAAFANAGKGLSQAGTEQGDPDEWSDLIDINVKGLLWTAKLTMPHLRETKGHFLLTSSAAGRMSIKGSVYGASKWFAYGFGRNLAEEMAEWGGRCTTICPGMVNTPFFDEEKPTKLQPEDVAEAVAYAIEAQARNNVREVFIMPTKMG